MAKFTLDAEAVIGLNNIHHLDEILEALQKNGDFIYMAEENFYEVDTVARTKIKKAAKDIIKGECKDFQPFRDELADVGIAISGNDKYVPFIGKLTESDYIVTFDNVLTRKVNAYKAVYDCSFMIPISTIGLLKYLYEKRVLSYSKYMKIGLKYFKYEELANIHKGILNQEWDIKTIQERFQLYKDPIVESYEKRISDTQRRIDNKWRPAL